MIAATQDVYSLVAIVVASVFAGGAASLYRTRLTARPERDTYISSAAEAAVKLMREALTQTQADLTATKEALARAKEQWQEERKMLEHEIDTMKRTELALRREVDRLRVLVEGNTHTSKEE